MRFREEVLAKIFTYITVVVLLGIVAFEAWGLSRERSRRKDAEDNAAVLQEEVENMRDINTTLKKENGELSAFRNKWNVYVSSLTSSEVLELQHDLFMRTFMKSRAEIRLFATKGCMMCNCLQCAATSCFSHR